MKLKWVETDVAAGGIDQGQRGISSHVHELRSGDRHVATVYEPIAGGPPMCLVLREGGAKGYSDKSWVHGRPEGNKRHRPPTLEQCKRYCENIRKASGDTV